MKVPFIDLTREVNECHSEIIEKCDEVIKSGQFILGANVKMFEKEIAEYLQVKHVVSVGNGSDALVFILRSLGIGDGDEVICPSNSFIASGWAIAAVGAKPVFCDVEDDFLISYKSVQRHISERTKAIMAVHLTGRVVEFHELRKLAAEYGLEIVEDAAQAFGAHNENDIFAGALGVAGAISLHPLKNLSVCGDGGLITTNSNELAENCRLLRNHGLISRDEAKIWGFNSRLDEIQAAIGLVKMKYIDRWIERYIEIAHMYDQYLSERIKKPKIRKATRDVYHNYVICVDSEIRYSIQKHLEVEGVETKVHYPIPIHKQECALKANDKTIYLRNTERLAKEMISLPIYPNLRSEEIMHVAKCVNNAYKKFAQ